MNLPQLADRWLFDQMAQGMLVLDRERRVIAVNRFAQEFLQLREEDAVGRHCWDVTGFSLCAERCPFPAALASDSNQKSFDFECLRGKQNAALCLNLTPLRDDRGETVAVMETFQDASLMKELADRLQRKQALLSSEIERSRTLVSSIADGIYSVDLDMRLTSFSRSAEQMTGFREEEVLGRPCREIFHASVCDTDCPLQWTLRNQQPVQNCTATLVGKDGRRIPAFLSSDLLRDAGGAICGCIGIIRDRSEVESLKAKLHNEYSFADFVGKSKAMVEIFERIRTVAATEATVLIEGESGTGKEILARAIHFRSARKGGPFVKVNCASLNESLLESELFGHEKGAFTGAIRRQAGTLRAGPRRDHLPRRNRRHASLALQAKLLRVLQEKEFERVGGIETLPADVRVIAATNKNLLKAIERGTFREDLYYRLCVVPLALPPLRQRKEDIPLLVETSCRSSTPAASACARCRAGRWR